MLRTFVIICACVLTAAAADVTGNSDVSAQAFGQLGLVFPSAEPVAAATVTAASVAGKWKVKAQSSAGKDYDLELELTNHDGSLSGTLSSSDGAVELQNTKLEGSALSFRLSVDEGDYTVKLTVAGNSMKGKYSCTTGENGTVAATRE